LPETEAFGPAVKPAAVEINWLTKPRKYKILHQTFVERTVGEGDVQVALPGHLPRFVYGVLRCKKQQQQQQQRGCLFTAHSLPGFITTPKGGQ